MRTDNPDERVVAIIGMSGRFPGAKNTRQFWENLRDGIESVAPLTDRDLVMSGVGNGARADPNFVPVGSVLEDIDLFDAAFFGMSPREAESLDPQHRLFLETAWNALEDSGHNPDDFDGSIGVYGGCATSSYLTHLREVPDFIDLVGHLQVHIGNEKDYLTSRVSHALNLKGPSFSIQTACSTSLLSVAVAADQLISHQCDMALAGGVCVRVPHRSGYYYEPGGIYSPDGHCRVFDEKASGVVFGNGVGIVVLKRLADALADQDPIYAVMRGWAVNNDGAKKASYAAPSLDGQADVIARALKVAQVDAETVTYVEAHGTGTTVGDPIEVAALTKAFRLSTDRKNFCALGSVKTNVGHLDPAAGVAGLIKTILALQERQIPPTLNCDSPNPSIDFVNSPFRINRELFEWKSSGKQPRRAGVSAFGIGGTNVHVVLEEAPPRSVLPPDESGHHMLVMSARSSSTLDEMLENLFDHLIQNPDLESAGLAYTLQVGRKAWDHRCAAMYSSVADLTSILESRDRRRLLATAEPPRERVVTFMFSGQGAQYVNMGRELYEHQPLFRRTLDRCLEILEPRMRSDPRAVLFASSEHSDEASTRLAETEVTQPMLFALEYSLSQLWMSWGIQPTSMIGHSIGEYVAACLAGVFSLEDALALVAVRGELMQDLPSGSMLAVPLSETEARNVLPPDLDVAAVNEPSSCVVSGPTASVTQLQDRLQGEGHSCRLLKTSHAFHSSMMDPILETFVGKVQELGLQRPEIPYVSNVTGTWITSEEATSAEYWARHIRSPVRFMEGMKHLLEDDDRVLVEVGPGQALGAFARRNEEYRSDQLIVSSLPHQHDERPESALMLESLARLWLSGVPVEWSALHAGRDHQKLHLPVYPFERRRYWATSANDIEQTELPDVLKEGDIADWFYTPKWRTEPLLDGDVVKTANPWVVFEQGGSTPDAVVSTLHQMGDKVVRVSAGTEFRSNGTGSYEVDPKDAESYVRLFKELRKSGGLPRTILHMWNIGLGSNNWIGQSGKAVDLARWHAEAEDKGYYSVIYTAQALAKARVNHEVDLLIVTSGAYGILDDTEVLPGRALVSGACKAIPQEYPNLRCRVVDVDPTSASADDIQTMADQILAEVRNPKSDSVVALRKSERLVQVFEPMRVESSPVNLGRLRRAGVYLITGGLGRIGLSLGEHLARTAGAKLVLLSRSAIPPKSDWTDWIASRGSDDATSKVLQRLQNMEAQGGEVLVVAADVSSADQLADGIAVARERFGSIHGVIHAAGNVTADGFFGITEANREMSTRQFQAKVAGTTALASALSGEPLDFVILLSSISSVLAGLGYVAYAAANIFMDAFAERQCALTSVPWVSVNLDTWDDEPEPAGAQKLSMSPEEGVEVIRRILGLEHPTQVVVSTGSLQARIDQWIDIESLRAAKRRHDTQSDYLHPRPELATAYVGPRNGVEQQVTLVVGDLLGVAEIGVFDNFFTDLGGTSLLGTHLVARLRETFDVELPLRQFYAGPTIADLSTAIASEREMQPGGFNVADGSVLSKSAAVES